MKRKILLPVIYANLAHALQLDVHGRHEKEAKVRRCLIDRYLGKNDYQVNVQATDLRKRDMR